MKRINRVYLIRHGQVKGYENFPAYGHTDVGLTDIGTLQMELMSERLHLIEPNAIYSSDLTRAAKGARLIARHHDVPVHLMTELREMYFGDWEGLPLLEIRKRFPEELKKRQEELVNFEAPGGGETVGAFSDRITTWLDQILAEQNGNDIVIVSHSGVNRIILCKALGLDLSHMFNIHQDYGCINIIDYFSDSTLVRLING